MQFHTVTLTLNERQVELLTCVLSEYIKETEVVFQKLANTRQSSNPETNKALAQDYNQTAIQVADLGNVKRQLLAQI